MASQSDFVSATGGVDVDRSMMNNKSIKSTVAGSQREPQADRPSITGDIRGADYYHGLIPRSDVEPLLKKDGDFLLRKTEAKPGMIVLALSVKVEGKPKHFMINMSENSQFYFESHYEKTIHRLITYHMSKKVSVASSTPAYLKRPIERSPWMINHDSIVIVKKLGEGAFGEVFLAEFESGKGRKIEVAVKTMRSEATRDARLKFMKEARLMRKYSHKHVVKILGVAVHEHPLMLTMEVCHNGALLSYLRKNAGKIDLREKLRFCVEASDGLAYLEKKQCIHRDIAARNCLLSSKMELKISDFGMSDDRSIIHDDTLNKVPVKWLAPETLTDKIYSLKSDVWAFGVLIWEIYSDGSEPYKGMSNVQARAKVVSQGYRMPSPAGAPKEIGDLLHQKIWVKNPAERIDMTKCQKKLHEMWEKTK
ncbi:hypothetical protein WR25_17509 [Diploscapter pachys]|uniref:Tyrosine-protein kinase n=1 Tax=Diploscapter pachys TaxID=2018661 RepID=A0A2A2L6U8_9BILA|nr:hypothetical protein WR25_17509 [Diploscapter pachys]